MPDQQQQEKYERIEKGSGDEDNSNNSDGNEGDDGSPQVIVNVDFEFFDPKQSDFHGVKALLNSYLDDAPVDLSGLVGVVLSQTTVGTVIKTADDDNPIGLITCLNLHRYKDQQCLQHIGRFLLAKGQHSPAVSKLASLLERKQGVGLIISERLINVPAELSVPIHQALFDEIEWATEDEPTVELRNSYKFDNYLILTRVFEDQKNKKPKKKKGGQHEAKRQKLNDDATSGELIYIKPEDEVFHKLSSWSFTFPVNAEALAAHQTASLKQKRLLMCFDPKKVPTFREKLQKLVAEGE